MDQIALQQFLNKLEEWGIKIIPHPNTTSITGVFHLDVSGWSAWRVWEAKAETEIIFQEGKPVQIRLSLHPESMCQPCLDEAYTYVTKLTIPNVEFGLTPQLEYA